MLEELVHCCAVAQDQELTCSPLPNIPVWVPETFQQHHDVFHCITKVFGCIPEDGAEASTFHCLIIRYEVANL